MIQAAQDVASHIVSDRRLGEPRTNQELFELLANAGWVDPADAAPLRRAAGFRNVLVHGYTTVDPSIVVDIVEHRLGVMERFVKRIRSELASSKPSG